MASISRAHSIVGYNPDGRPDDDFYPTPESTTEALLRVEDFDSQVWEPACGDGAICKVLLRNRYSVLPTDLFDHHYGTTGIDFLKTESGEYTYPSIITNPPFKLFTEFAYHAMVNLKVRKLALFGKLAALEGAERSKILEQTGLTRVHIFRKRQTLTRNGVKMKNSGMIAYAWYVWMRENRSHPQIYWI